MAKKSAERKRNRQKNADPPRPARPEPVAPQSAQDRIYGFDTLRALATLIILVFHYTTHYDKIYGHLGHIVGTPRLEIGVPTFLILSGFLNVMILERTRSLLDWAVGKFLRLFPVYWVACLITFSAVTVFMLPGRMVSLHDGLINLTMIQMLLHVPHIDGVYWTLQVVLFFYVIIGLLSAAGLRMHLVPTFMALTALDIAGRNFKLLAGVAPETLHVVESVLVLQYACFFMIGMVIYRLKAGFRLWHLAGVALFFIDIYTSSRWHKAPVLYFLPVVVFLVARYRIPGLDNRVFRFIAGISYALYIIHQNVGFLVIRWVYNYANGYVAIAAATAVAVTLAVALTYLVEQPVARFFKARYHRWRGRGGIGR